MAGQEGAEPVPVAEKNILYDRLVPVEWPDSVEILDSAKGLAYLWKRVASSIKDCLDSSSEKVRRPLLSLGLVSNTSSAIIKVLNSRLPWRLAITSEGTFLAVLKEDMIEIRTLFDGFDKAHCIIRVERDPKSQWRQLVWNEEGNLLAYGRSNGFVQVFSSAGSLLGQFGGVVIPEGGLRQAIASFVFMPQQKNDPDNVLSVLCVLLFDGTLNTYQISPAGPVHLHSFSFTDYLPEGVGCMLYHSDHSLLLVGGTSLGEGCGVSGWRLLDDAPFWGPKVGQQIQRLKKGYISGLIARKKDSEQNSDMIVDMSLSPSGASLAVIDVAGNLSIVEVPSFRRKKFWSVEELPVNKQTATEDLNKVSPLPIQVSWWSEEALILANECGEISVLSVHSLSNLLSGGHVTGWSITPATNDQFFLLQCDTKRDSLVHRSRVPSLSEDSEKENEEEEEEKEREESFSISQFSSNMVKKVLYFITDSERFRTNTKKKTRILRRKYRLTCIKAVTPAECYERKLRAEDYEEALRLAREYDLDSDLVYQRQWQSYQVSPATIQDYLSQVSNRSWVLQECLHRTTTDYTSTRNLLEYGLTRTNFKELVDLGGELEHLNSSLAIETATGSSDKQTEDALKCVEMLAGVERLSPEQVSLCQYRHLLLCYLDRLDTYEVILHGPAVTEKVFECKEYETFRSRNLLQSAISYARDGEWGALEALFTYHGKVLLPHRLSILFNFPETTPPKIYCSLLPAVSAEGEVIGWNQECHRDADWVDSDLVRKLCSLPDEAMSNCGDFIYEENSEWRQFEAPLSSEIVALWYITRATEIEEFSGQVNCSLQLIELAMERGVKGLAECHHQLKTLSTLVYECNVDSRLNLKKFKSLADLEVVELMMRDQILDGQPQSGFVSGLENWVLPYLSRLDSITPSRSRGILKNYLTQISKESLEPCLAVLLQSNTTSDAEGGAVPILRRVGDRIELAISCIYACDKKDQLNVADQIVECLPSRTHESSTEEDADLHDQVDMLENYINATDILLSYGIERPAHFVRDMQGSNEEAEQLMVMLTRTASRKQPPMSKEGWDVLLENLLSLRETIFSFVDQVTCYKIYTESLLCSSVEDNIHLATRHLSLAPPTGRGVAGQGTLAPGEGSKFKLSYEVSVELAVKAAKEYFNSAANLMDSEMDLARACLGLFTSPCPQIQHELNLIASLSLLDDFKVSMLPVQVRLCENKLDVVRAVLDSSLSAYKRHEKILRLCKMLDSEHGGDATPLTPSSLPEGLLGISEEVMTQDQGHATILIVMTALDKQDYKLAHQLCSRLMQIQFAPAWEICRMMGMDARIGDYNTRLRLLDFSITHCPPEELTSLLQSKQILQFQSHCAQCGVGRDGPDAGERGMSSSQGGGARTVVSRGSVVGRSVQQLVSRGAGAVQQLIRTRSTATVSSEFKSPEADISSCLSSLRAAAAHIDSGVVDTGKNRVSQLSYHPFYSTDLKELFTYERSSRQSVDGKAFLLQTLLRGLLLQPDPKQSGACGEVLLKLAELCSKKDVLLSITYLLTANELQDFDQWVSQSSSVKLSLELILYCVSLHLYNLCTLTLDNAPPPYLYPPSSLVSHMTGVVESHDKVWSEQQQPWVDLFRKYQHSLADHSQGLVLQMLGIGVDLDQFAQSEDYKKATILTLARSSDPKLFSTAISLGRRHGIDLWEIHITLLSSLLTTSISSVSEIEKKIKERNILKYVLEEPQKSADYLKDTTYPELPGLKYGILLLYYSILQQCLDSGAKIHEMVNIEVHIKLLSKFKSALHGVDYKQLMSGDEDQDPLLILIPALDHNNVRTIAKLAGKIPCGAKSVLTQGAVLCGFALKIFWKGARKEGQATKRAEVNWSERYESCVEYVRVLSPVELHHFVLGSALCEKSLQLPMGLRCELISRTLSLLASSDKPPPKSGMTREELAVLLRNYLKHLQNVDQLCSQDSGVSEKIEKKFLAKFDLSLSETNKIHSLVLEMIESGLSPETVDLVLKLSHSVQPHRLSAPDLFKEVLQSSLSSPDQSLQDTEQLEVVMRCISEHESRGGSVVSSADVLEILRPFCSDSSKGASARKRLFVLIERYLFLSSDDLNLMLYQQTEALVFKVFNREIALDDISNSSSQQELFCSLLSLSKTPNEYTTLCSLLDNFQSTMDSEAATRCAVDLLESAVASNAPAELVVFVRAGLSSIPLEVDEKLFLYVSDASVREALKYSLLLSGNEQMFEKALGQLESDPSLYSHDGDLLEMLLHKGKFPSLRKNGSVLCAHLSQYLRDSSEKEPNLALFARLLHCPEDEVLDKLGFRDRAGRVKKVAQQLYDGGYVMEAGAILVSSQSFHSAVSTLSDSLAYVTAMFSKK